MTHFTSLKKHRLLPLLLVAVTVFTLLAGIPPISAMSSSSPRLVVGSTTYVAAGAMTTTPIKIQSMPPFDAFDIRVFANKGAIDPQSVAAGSALSNLGVFAACIDGVSVAIPGCSINDGPGVIRVVGYGSASSVHNGVLFTITYKAVDSVNSVIAIGCQQLALTGGQVNGIVVKNGVYSPTGTLLSSALPTYTLSTHHTYTLPTESFVMVPAGSSQTFVVQVISINGFGDDVSLTVSTSPSVTATISPGSVSCSCNAVGYATQLTIQTTNPGTFTVTVNGLSTPSSIPQSETITVFA